MKKYFVFILLLSLLLSASLSSASSTILKMEIKGAIGPAVADYIGRGIRHAHKIQASLILMTLDTPGGLVSSTRSINKEILASEIPIAIFVWPKGAHAASAGTYILYASHIAAMAPATNLGAATPVNMGGGDPGGSSPFQPKKPDDKSNKDRDDSKQNDKSQEPKTAMGRKVLNDAVAYIESLAQLRKRNKAWAKKAVLQGDSLPAEEAKAQNVIEYLANDVDDLLTQLHGVKVKMAEEKTLVLNTADQPVEDWLPDWRNKILTIITDPNIAYVFLLLAFYGIMLEFWNPGAIVPGVVGAISLLIALYALQLLPISYAGLALIILGIAFMVAEALVPSFGILGFGGVVAFITGSLFLFDTELETYQLSLALIVAVALCNIGVFTLVIGMIYKNRNNPVVSGLEYMMGMEVMADEAFEEKGRVWVQGESWEVISASPIKQGQALKITGHSGLVLTVEPLGEEK